MLKVNVSNSAIGDKESFEGKTFEIEQSKDNWVINGEPFDGDVAGLGKNRFHVIWKNRSFSIEILSESKAEKSMHLIINGRHYHTGAQNRLDLLLEGMGINNNAAPKLNNVKAPMPGLIQSIAVSEGEQITKGDTLLVLVAMKMENVIKSSGNGIVKSLKVTAGEIVEKNQVLLEFQ